MTKRDQSRSDKATISETNKAAKELLDQRAKELSDRHLLRLEKMTASAEAHYLANQNLENHGHNNIKINNLELKNRYSNKYKINFRPLTIPLVLASSTLFVFWLWWPAGQPSRLQNKPVVAKSLPSDSAVPEWVMDSSVPVSLLNNQVFFDWLSKQEDTNKHG